MHIHALKPSTVASNVSHNLIWGVVRLVHSLSTIMHRTAPPVPETFSMASVDFAVYFA
jgi:hypothetical protein